MKDALIVNVPIAQPKIVSIEIIKRSAVLCEDNVMFIDVTADLQARQTKRYVCRLSKRDYDGVRGQLSLQTNSRKQTSEVRHSRLRQDHLIESG
jgi:hypothetical protein